MPWSKTQQKNEICDWHQRWVSFCLCRDYREQGIGCEGGPQTLVCSWDGGRGDALATALLAHSHESIRPLDESPLSTLLLPQQFLFA
ncbi:MAG: hypothetical protein CMH81_08065 [Nitrospiraceae bacterium]|nr:hypothetical protein [Nitrospiraceae bacterium]